MDRTRVMAIFDIYGDSFEPSSVTDFLDIQPTQTYTKGEPTQSGKNMRKETCWSISTGYQESDNINHQLEQIMRLLREKTEELKKIRQSLAVEMLFMFVVKIENGEPAAMYFGKEFLHFASAIDAEVGFDVYIHS